MVHALGGLRISDISLLIPPDLSLHGDSQFHVNIMYDGKTGAKTAKRRVTGDRVSWDESFSSARDITGDSVITFTVVKTQWLISKTTSSSKQKVLDLIQSLDHSGLCKLEMAKQYWLLFSIQETSDVTPAIVDELSNSNALTRANVEVSAGDVLADDGEEDAWSLFLSHFQIFLSVIDAIVEINPYAKLAWGILSAIPKTILSHRNRADRIHQLCEKLTEVYDYITDTKRLPELTGTRSKALPVLVQQTVECAYFIREYTFGNTAGRLWKGASIDEKMKAFNEKLDHIMNVITKSVTLETNIITLRVADTINETKDLILLGEMPYARDAGFISGKRCFPGTRQNLINEIVEWVNSDMPQRILVLNGQAGIGKSSVAHTIAEIFQKQNRLGSLFCFNRIYKDRYKLLFSTISRGLADSDVSWRKSLVKVIENTAIRTSTDPVTQFNELIAKPSKETAIIGPVIIVIDALDESGDREEREAILDLLFRGCSELPINYRFVVTSRPEQDIELLLGDPTTVLCKRMGDITTDETLSDIQSYVSSRLKPIASILDKIDGDWRNILAQRSQGLFQWAETACRFINPTVQYLPTIQKRWTTCVSSASSSLYEFYEQLISSQPECEDPQFVDDFKRVVAGIMMTREPLSIDALQSIFQDTIPDIRGILYPFGSLFLGVHDSFTPVRPLHTSLFDFFKHSDTNPYYINTSDETMITLGCLRVMNRMLRFNICDLETSHRRNKDVPDLNSRVEKATPPCLSYACRTWPFHLHASNFGDELITEIRVLMHQNLLYFFEVLSLLGDMESGHMGLRAIEVWCRDADGELVAAAVDAAEFLYECGEAIMESTPHLYISALPFAPGNSFIAKQYLPLYPRLFVVEISQSPSEAESTYDVTPHKADHPFIERVWVRGSYLILFYSTIRPNEPTYKFHLEIFNTTTIDAKPLLKLENENSFLVAVPADDQHAYVAYVTSRGLCLWGETEGEVIVDTSMHPISALAFSPAGDRLILGDSDGNIKMYHIHDIHRLTCEIECTVPAAVDSLAVSTSGTRFLVAYRTSEEKLILEIRNCGTITAFEISFTSLENNVPKEVAFSANDTHIVCVSSNGVEIWDVATKTYRSFKQRLLLSPNRKLVALINENDVTLWDIENEVAPPSPWSNHPHSDLVSFRFSDDSTRVIKMEKTDESQFYFYVYIWELHTRELVVKQFPGRPHWNLSDGCLALHGNRLLMAPYSDSFVTIRNIDMFSIMLPLYEYHQDHSEFGMFSVDQSEIRRSIETHHKSLLNTADSEVLDYALSAWDKALFSAYSELDDQGWMLGPHGELLFWVPKRASESLWRPCMTYTTFKGFAKLYFDKFVHGSRWMECISVH